MMLLSKWHFQLLLRFILLNSVLSTGQRNVGLLSRLLNRSKPSLMKSIIEENQVMVFGHSHPDTDSALSALILADFLHRLNINAKAYRLGDLDNESKFVLKTAGIEQPDLLPDDIPNGTEVALVDHNESKLKHLFFITLID